MDKPEFPASVQCPCCNQRVSAPTFEILIDACKIAPQQARILGALWKSKGRPVPTGRILDAMYADDPDGGPSDTAMYRSFQWSLHYLRAALKGSGWAIQSAGYNLGYRLVTEAGGTK